ncbi:MAG: redoxin domain-containing protein, partial [Candidatus Bathyarchaeia archaeon]
MCGFRDNLSKFKDANSELLAISVDSQFADKTWSKELNLNFPVLSDFNKDVTKAYGVLHGDTGFFKEKLNLVGVSKRSIFIVDKQGVVRYKWITEDPTQLPSQDVILAELGKLK